MGSKMLLSYNILPQRQETYLRFMLNDFIPALQKMGLSNIGVWHTAYGNYPMRLLVFAAETGDAMERVLESEIWTSLETKLKGYVTDYTRRIVPFDSRFQF